MLEKSRDINFIRETAVEELFRRSIGKNVLILTEEFPFLVIGKIKELPVIMSLSM